MAWFNPHFTGSIISVHASSLLAYTIALIILVSFMVTCSQTTHQYMLACTLMISVSSAHLMQLKITLGHSSTPTILCLMKINLIAMILLWNSPSSPSDQSLDGWQLTLVLLWFGVAYVTRTLPRVVVKLKFTRLMRQPNSSSN